MLEMFVLILCIKEVECNQLQKAYLAHNKQIKMDAKKWGKKMQRTEPEAALFTVVAYTGMINQKVRLRLPYNVNMEYRFPYGEVNTVNLNWRYDF